MEVKSNLTNLTKLIKLALVLMSLIINPSLFANENNSHQSLGDNYSQEIALEKFSGTLIQFLPIKSIASSTLSISGPNQFFVSINSDLGLPSIELSEYEHLADGFYQYQLTSGSTEQVLQVSQKVLDNGRDEEPRQYLTKELTQSGHFFLESGVIKQFSNSQKSTR